jgi:adenylosuccinate synthase
MTNIVLVGTQWGDEGKGRITDFLSNKVDMVVRYQGGDNAGHTVILQGQEFKLHLVPSGILYPWVTCVIGNGVVINPETLITEINNLEEKGIKTDNLKISSNCHLIMPYHIALDSISENSLGPLKIGTTKKGIGPVYADKASRSGIRVCDLFDKISFKQKLSNILKIKNAILSKVYNTQTFDFDKIFDQYESYADVLKKYVVDSVLLINQAIDEKKNILFEGAQGTLLDIDHGTYPYVTSSNTIAGGVFSGSGIGPKKIDKVIGIAKAYCTRVGSGVFPTEQSNEIGDYIRNKGGEYGTTTGRARRCGWFDCVMIKYSAMINSLDSLALTKLDVLTGLEKVKICISYLIDGEEFKILAPDCEKLGKGDPIYMELDGWDEDLTNIKDFKNLPTNARKYIEVLEELAGIPISIISVGPDRDQLIVRDEYSK